MFITVLAIEGIVPFGDKTFLMFDLKRQYVDYYAYYKTIIGGENDIFYSFSTTLGSGIIGFIAYYMTSPFLLLTLLFDQSSMPLCMTVIIGIKLMLAAFIMDLFLQEHVTLGNRLAVIICSVSWAFSGFLFANSNNMMWTDVVILVPVLIHFLEKVLTENRKAPYIITLSLMLVFNYYISYQVLIFVALWTITRLYIKEFDRPFHLVFRVIGSTFLAGVIPAALLVPTAIELVDSPKDISAKGFVLNGKNLTLTDLFSKLPTLAFDENEQFFGYPQLFVGVLLVFLILMFFMSQSIPKRERIGMFALLAIFAVSFCSDFVNVIWHAGMEPAGHPYRQAYLCVFVMIICACRALEFLREDISYLKVLICGAVIFVFLYLIKNGMYDHIFPAGLKINYILVSFYILAFAVCVFVRKEQNRMFEVLITGLLVANMADLTANALFTYIKQSPLAVTQSAYSEQISENLEAVNNIRMADSSFYRIETYSPREQNDSLQYAYNGVTHYSSAGLLYVRYFLQRLGFNDDVLHTDYGHDNTATADSILGVKYVMNDGPFSVHPSYEKVSGGDIEVYRNPYALPLAIGTDGYDLEGISDLQSNDPDVRMLHVPKTDPFSLQEDIYDRLLGKDISIFRHCSFDESSLYEKGGVYTIDFEVSPAADGEMYAYFDGLIGAAEDLYVYVDGDFVSGYGNASCVKILNLGYRRSGEKVSVSLTSEDPDADFGSAVFVTEDTDALESAFKDADDARCEVKKLRSSYITVDTGDHDGVFLTVPFQKGWSVKVDDKEVVPVAVYDSLTYIPIEQKAPSHHIDMVYETVGLKIGIILSLAGILVFIGIVVSEKNRS